LRAAWAEFFGSLECRMLAESAIEEAAKLAEECLACGYHDILKGEPDKWDRLKQIGAMDDGLGTRINGALCDYCGSDIWRPVVTDGASQVQL
jgi:hypothetical protein